MRERPILFSGPMVRAILDGRKTQTRRVLGVPDDTTSVRWVEDAETLPDGAYTGWVAECGAPLLLPRKCPYGQPGDRLWVRETWSDQRNTEGWNRVCYAADFGTMHNFCYPWKPSIHMPRWASRLTLDVVEVRVERLQEITEADAIAEGYADSDNPPWPTPAREWFQLAWDAINAKRGHSWDSNPWVWVVEFRRAPESATEEEPK